jgi:hypothetical protein
MPIGERGDNNAAGSSSRCGEARRESKGKYQSVFFLFASLFGEIRSKVSLLLSFSLVVSLVVRQRPFKMSKGTKRRLKVKQISQKRKTKERDILKLYTSYIQFFVFSLSLSLSILEKKNESEISEMYTFWRTTKESKAESRRRR